MVVAERTRVAPRGAAWAVGTKGLPTWEEVRAALAVRSLSAFIRQAWPVVEPATPFVPNWHLDCIAAHLEAVSAGQLRRLLITVPPRTMKSLSVSVFWPAWVWASVPARRWLFSSYALSLSIRDSVKCRRLLESPWYRQRWGHVFALTSDQNQKMRFDNDATGYRLATSVGGANTGEGAGVIVVDDAHNVAEAESDPEREGVLSWWDEVMATRGDDPKTSARVIVMQRVHQHDLAGHVLERGGYHHLCLPMRYEPRVQVDVGSAQATAAARAAAQAQAHDDCPIARDPRTREGELLCPARFGEPEVAALERDLGPYAAAGQLQQRPVPREGALFKSQWLQPLPADLRRERLTLVTFVDLAFSEKDTACYTAAVTLGIDVAANDGRLYVLHVWRDRIDETRLDEALATQIAAVPPTLVGVEEGAFKQATTRDLVRRLQRLLDRRGVAVAVVPVKVTTDKVFRARLPAARAQAGLVYGDRVAPWWAAFETELLAFPRGAYKDQVDALSGATQLAVEGAALAAEDTAPTTYAFAPAGTHGARQGGPLAPAAPAAGAGEEREDDSLRRELFEPKLQRPAAQRPRWPFLTAEQQAQLERALAAQRVRGGGEEEDEA